MQAIGVFDSGYGGLTVHRAITSLLPQYDYLYLGDNARSPYGTRSFETVYQYTLQAVEWLFAQGCPLVILACNTASAKALRSIQQRNLPHMPDPSKRVLGVIRPTTEVLGTFTNTGHIGIMATQGTVQSASYLLEMEKFWPRVQVHQQACPMWVPLIENNEQDDDGADYFVNKYLNALLALHPAIDTLLLACTHYPLMYAKIRAATPASITLLSQGDMVAQSLQQYLVRHPQMEQRISQGGQRLFFTTDDATDFSQLGTRFYGSQVAASHVNL